MKRRLALAASVMTASLVGLSAAACAPSAGVDLDVTSGTSSTAEFPRWRTYFGLDALLGDMPVDWVVVKTWDSDEIFLRYTTSTDGARAVLDNFHIPASELGPADGNSQALPSNSDHEGTHPSEIPDWEPAKLTSSRMVSDFAARRQDGAPLYVDALFETQRAGTVVVYLHVLNF